MPSLTLPSPDKSDKRTDITSPVPEYMMYKNSGSDAQVVDYGKKKTTNMKCLLYLLAL